MILNITRPTVWEPLMYTILLRLAYILKGFKKRKQKVVSNLKTDRKRDSPSKNN